MHIPLLLYVYVLCFRILRLILDKMSFGMSIFFQWSKAIALYFFITHWLTAHPWFSGEIVSTLSFESRDPSSNPVEPPSRLAAELQAFLLLHWGSCGPWLGLGFKMDRLPVWSPISRKISLAHIHGWSALLHIFRHANQVVIIRHSEIKRVWFCFGLVQYFYEACISRPIWTISAEFIQTTSLTDQTRSQLHGQVIHTYRPYREVESMFSLSR